MLPPMSLVHVITALLYPPACLVCRRRIPSGESLCAACLAGIPRVGLPICTRCGLWLSGAFDARLICRTCRERPLAFDAARAPWEYAGVAKHVIQHFKYHRRWRVGQRIAEDMARCARTLLPLAEVDAIIPVPLHWLKRRLRGFDSTAQLARSVATAMEKPYRPGVVSRRRWTATQTARRWHQRFRNVHGAFTATRRAVEGRTLLVIDDVLTSGATADACARALKEAGARAVFVLTAARTPVTHGK